MEYLFLNNLGFGYCEGKFGPFMPDFDAQVPIWLALMLKRQKKCRVLAPHWMEVGAVNFEIACTPNLVCEKA